jgi:hypothetical protein
MKYGILPSIMWRAYKGKFAGRMKRMFPRENPGAVMEGARRDYRRIVESIPEFDRDDGMKATILNASLFLSIYENMERKPEVGELREYYRASMMDSLVTRAYFGSTRLFTRRYQERLRSDAERSRNRDNPYAWKFSYEKGPSLDRFSAFYSQCGICRLAAAEEVREIVPALCAFDYPMAEMMGARFERKTTLASGGDRCDCHYARA